MGLSQRLIQSPKLVQERRILLNHAMFEIPILVIDRTIDVILNNPEIVEGRLKTEKGSGGGNPLFYCGVIKEISGGIATANTRITQGRKTEGVKLHFGDVLEAKVDDKTMALPDITYHVRGYGDFSMLPAEHFKPSKMELRQYQLTSDVKRLVVWLLGQRNWIVKTLEDCYLQIGKRQAGFLLKLDPSELIPLPRSNIGYLEQLPYHHSTYYRLLKNRSVCIDSQNGKVTLPVFYLLPNLDQVALYNILPSLNNVLRSEIKSGIALSDEELSKKLGKISRRAVTKYRDLAGIPPSGKRQKMYDEGVKESFRIPTSIEQYLPKNQAN
ncbi:hypothetical protein J4480_05165 [Candidatus Woesearchaeota archaeon]|nr:hypothetical protein [Candidatus Woesearchaeota archaeon]